jgi:hypothetical protein
MTHLDIDEIQFKNILEVFAQIKTNCNDLTIFFRNIAQDIDITETSMLTSVVETAEVIRAHQEERDRKESCGLITFYFPSFESLC